jgi:uncharacterized membrane protein
MKVMDHEKKYLKEEIRKEFQLERMIVFSDAVFAIAITLMAIEIHIPDEARFTTSEQLIKELIKLMPSIMGYTASFIFIGFTWYQHLQVFSLLKDYDKGIVLRNLIMLFFIGFFPFSASLIARPYNGIFLNIIMYFLIIFLCKGAQLVLHHYILVKRPQLCIAAGIPEELIRYKKTRIAVIGLVIVFVLVTTTFQLIPDPDMKYWAWWWFMLFPFGLKYFQRKIEKKQPASH